MSVSTKILRKEVSDDGRDVLYEFEDGRTRRFHSEAHAHDQCATELTEALRGPLMEALAIVLDQTRGEVEGKTVTVDPRGPELVDVL